MTDPVEAPTVEKKKKSKKEKKEKKKSSRKEKGENKSGVRTKFILESLRQDYYRLQDENRELRLIIEEKLPNVSEVIFAECCPPRKKVGSIDELASTLPSMTISEGEEEDEEDDDE